MKPSCKCKPKTGAIKCSSLEEKHRRKIFEAFWKMTWGEKKVFVNSQVISLLPKRASNRKNPQETKRLAPFCFQYFLKTKSQNVRACRTMFLNTLDVGRWTVLHWKIYLKLACRVFRDKTQNQLYHLRIVANVYPNF